MFKHLEAVKILKNTYIISYERHRVTEKHFYGKHLFVNKSKKEINVWGWQLYRFGKIGCRKALKTKIIRQSGLTIKCHQTKSERAF